jgi:hypothetical protein
VTDADATPTLSIEDVILLVAAGAEGPYQLDPIRIMKGSFIASQAGRSPWRDQFHFRPYDYGPFDRRVYDARDNLVQQELVDVDRSRRYDTYVLTDAGRARVAELEAQFPDDCAWLERVGQHVTSRSFSRLLDEIYERWPEFATRSVAR